MTQLIIAGVEVALPQSFSVTVKRENPFFTKSGEYTYDCTLRLDNPVNQQLYGFLHRLNKIGQVATSRTAILIADGHVYCRGTEVITKWTDQTVSIQIVSGESELNWLVGQDQKIEDLDLGEVQYDLYTEDGTNDKVFTHSGTYPAADYCLAPIITEGGRRLNTRLSWIPYAAPQAPQPYLCVIIRRLLAALGYTIGQNHLEQTQFKNLFIVNTIYTSEVAKMLPGWTVKDFMTEVERLTGCVLITDNTDPEQPTCDILLKSVFYQDARQLPLNDVIDSYEAEVRSEDSGAEFTASNVSYNLPNHYCGKLMKLPEGFLDSTVVEQYADLDSILTCNDDNVCLDVSTGRMYVKTSRKYDLLGVESTETLWVEVDQFKDFDREGVSSNFEISITPAPMAFFSTFRPEIIYIGTNNMFESSSSTATDEETEEDEAGDTVAKIQSFEAQDSQASDLYCAFYCGNTTRAHSIGNETVQVVFTDAYHATIQKRLRPELITEIDTTGIAGSLRLQDLDADHYQGAYQIDTAHAVTFQTFDPNRIDVRQVYVIQNRRYVVRDVEETITAEGRQPMWKLTCYPIQISDEAIENRWILTRGVWDDGGAWLDDGRWNDGAD